MTKNGQTAFETKKYKYQEQLGVFVPYMEDSNVNENIWQKFKTN